MAASMGRIQTTLFARRITFSLMAIGMLMLLAGCAATAQPDAVGSAPGAAGFWLGLWQGFIAPIAFLVSLFNRSVGIYEVNNTGGWYDFGFLAGISVFFSGPAGRRRARRIRASR